MQNLIWADAGVHDCDSADYSHDEWIEDSSDTPHPPRHGMTCEVEVRSFDLEGILDLLKREAEWIVVLSKLPTLRAIAEELFLGQIDIEFESDPEIEDCHYVTFSVIVSGDHQDALSLRREWYRRTAKILGENCDKVRLVISMSQ